jgi:hypothetical protein
MVEARRSDAAGKNGKKIGRKNCCFISRDPGIFCVVMRDEFVAIKAPMGNEMSVASLRSLVPYAHS